MNALTEKATSKSYLSSKDIGYLHDFMDVLCYEFIHNTLVMDPNIHTVRIELSEKTEPKKITIYVTELFSRKRFIFFNSKSLKTKKVLEIKINVSDQNSLNKINLSKSIPELIFDDDKLIILEVDSLDKLNEVYEFLSICMRKFCELHHLKIN